MRFVSRGYYTPVLGSQQLTSEPVGLVGRFREPSKLPCMGRAGVVSRIEISPKLQEATDQSGGRYFLMSGCDDILGVVDCKPGVHVAQKFIELVALSSN